MAMLLLLSGDIEKNPGPYSWSKIKSPEFCNYLRVAIYKIFLGEKLLPDKDDSDSLKIQLVDGFSDLQILFGQNYEAHLIDLKSLKKHNSRFMEAMVKWGRTASQARNEYCDIFSPIEYNKLDDLIKKKHTIICNECPKLPAHGMFPSSANIYKNERTKSPAYAIKVAEKIFKKKTLKESTK